MTRSKFALRAVAAAAGTLAIAALALPAIAADGDVTGTKTNNAGGPLQDGDGVTYTVTLENPTVTAQNDIQSYDGADNGIVYVAGSTEVTVTSYATVTVASDDLPQDGGDARTDYDFGTGWSGNWTEVNDDGDPDLGSIRRQGGVDQNALRIGGETVAPTDAADALANFPGITRAVSAAELAGIQGANLTFATSDTGLSGDDRLGVWVSVDGGPYQLAAEFADAANNSARAVNLDAYLPATDLSIRFGTSAGAYAAPTTAYWAVDDVVITGVEETVSLYDNDPSGLNNLDDGDATSWLTTTTDGIDLPGVVTFNSEPYTSGMVITYDAVIDFDELSGWPTYLENGAFWWSSTYTTSWTQWWSYVDIDYEPALEATVSSNGPVQAGQPIIITLVLEHSDVSDGSPVCADDFEPVAGYTAIVFTGDSGIEDCLEEGETWTFTITYPGQATAGTFAFAADFTGFSQNEDPEDGDVDVNATGDTDVVVVLADTGTANTGLAGAAAALVALGAAALVVARRRNA